MADDETRRAPAETNAGGREAHPEGAGMQEASESESRRIQEARAALAELEAVRDDCDSEGYWHGRLDRAATSLAGFINDLDEIRRAYDRARDGVSGHVETLIGQRDKLTRERDSLARRCAVRFDETQKLRAEADAMRPVVDAAITWIEASDRNDGPDATTQDERDYDDAGDRLEVAARTYIAGAGRG